MPGTKQLEFRYGDYLYRDIYYGMSFFAGQEVVYENDEPHWSMVYAGGIKIHVKEEARTVYAFRRYALRIVSASHPYQGAEEFRDHDFVYRNTHKGGIDRFQGTEKIWRADDELYSLNYSAGIVRT